MKKVLKLTETELINTIARIIREEDETNNYMFFSNLEQIKRQCDMLLQIDQNVLNDIINDGHDWADDHVTEAKTNMDQIFDFFMNEINKREQYVDFEPLEEGKKKKNTPTNPKLWQKSLSWAKSRYKVCPSAYCNGAAAKRYKSLGGKWTKK